jgi:hypothetical protein
MQHILDTNLSYFLFFLINIRYPIIKYHDSFTTTNDLANSVHGRGELSKHCMEVGIEYLRRTNTLVGKMIVPYQVSVYLLNGEFQKKALVSMFKRTENYSLSVMKQVSLCFFVFTCLLSFLARGG